jgi:hypothetical protein
MSNRSVLGLLLAGCVMLGATICVELAPDGGNDAPLPGLVPLASVRSAAHLKQNVELDALLEIAVARPLFSSTRRPQQGPADGEAVDTHLSDKRLTGIVTASGFHIAIFTVNDGKPLILAEGETVSGWRIETISPIGVALSGPGGNKTLRPKPDPNLAQPASTMNVAPTAQAPAAQLPRKPRIQPRR